MTASAKRQKVGKLIREKRKEQHLTQENFAKQVGVIKETILNWEKGYVNPRFTTVVKAARILKIDLQELA